MKDLWKKLNRQPETDTDLDTGYDSDYYVGSYPEDRGGRADDRRTDDRRYDDRRTDDRYDDRRADDRYDDRRTDDRRYDDRRYDDRRYDDRYADDRRADDRGYYDDPAPTYRDRGYAEELRREEPAPEVKPEHLYFTPATYKDCREAIVKGMASGHIVVVRVSKLDTENLLRLFDYMMGAALALEADMFRTSPEIIVIAPNGVEVDEDELEIPEDEDEYDEYDEYEDGYDEEDSDEDAE
jgi:FtsZ-interacting cell division protein YlmF